jgi:hypothetical protein
MFASKLHTQQAKLYTFNLDTFRQQAGRQKSLEPMVAGIL